MIQLLTAYAWMAAVLLFLGLVAPIEDGPLAVVLILSPYIALTSFATGVVAVMRRSRALTLPLVVAALLFAVRFGGEWTSFGASFGGDPGQGNLTVATWNIQAGENAGADTVAWLDAHPVDLVALQELTPDVEAAIERDAGLAARYPYRLLEPRNGVSGAGILSRFPIESGGYLDQPVRVEARLRLPDTELVVIGAHPFHADLSLVGGIPTGVDATSRNAELALLRARVAELEAGGLDVLLIGDFNTAPTEPAFGRLTTGLHDAHAEVGWGPGWTWRPARFVFLGTGLLRIDLILSTPGLVPVRTSIACPPAGDHCLVEAALALG